MSLLALTSHLAMYSFIKFNANVLQSPANRPDQALKHVFPAWLDDCPRKRSVARQVGQHPSSIVGNLRSKVRSHLVVS